MAKPDIVSTEEAGFGGEGERVNGIKVYFMSDRSVRIRLLRDGEAYIFFQCGAPDSWFEDRQWIAAGERDPRAVALRSALSLAKDNLARALMQQKRLPTWISDDGTSIDEVVRRYQEEVDALTPWETT